MLVKGKYFTAIIIAVSGAAILGIAAFFYFRSGSDTLATVSVSRGTITEEVSVTGKTTPIDDVRLSFEKSGRVARILVRMGDRVDPGQILVVLDQADLLAQLKQDQASRDAALAKLDSLKSGTRSEEVAVKQSELASADQALSSDYKVAVDSLMSAYTSANDAVRNKTDAMFSNDETSNPQITFSVSDSQLGTDFVWHRVLSSRALNSWQAELSVLSMSSSPEEIRQAIEQGQGYLSVVNNFLATGLSIMTKTLNVSSATVDTYKSNLTTASENVNTATASVNTDLQAILAQQASRDKARRELELALAGSRPEDIRNQEAQVAQAEAKIALTQAELAKTVLRSPISGTVTQQDFNVGEIAPANSALLAVISIGKLQIEANIPEVDIGKVKIGDAATVTFDAYGDEIFFEAGVGAVDPAETMIEGVATYKTTLYLNREDSRVKPGMTANIDIVTGRRENVLFIPARAISAEDGQSRVRVLVGENAEKRSLRTGLRGSDGNVEVTEGLSEGDKVILSREP